MNGRSSWPKLPGLAIALLVSLVTIWSGAARAEPELPPLERRVTDRAGLLAPEQQNQLEQQLAAYEKETGHQFALVTIQSLDGLPIEDYSIRLAEKWKLGDEARDDGVILLVAKADRKMRIEVGYGLEGAIPDALAAQVIRNQLQPAFRAGDFAGGINQAFDTLMRAAKGESVRVGPAPEDGSGEGSGGFSILPLLFWGLLLVIAMMRGGGGLLGGMMLGGMMGGHRRGGGGGFGGGFGGGGFSGGGGGFGGGGASGGW